MQISRFYRAFWILSCTSRSHLRVCQACKDEKVVARLGEPPGFTEGQKRLQMAVWFIQRSLGEGSIIPRGGPIAHSVAVFIVFTHLDCFLFIIIPAELNTAWNKCHWQFYYVLLSQCSTHSCATSAIIIKTLDFFPLSFPFRSIISVFNVSFSKTRKFFFQYTGMYIAPSQIKLLSAAIKGPMW